MGKLKVAYFGVNGHQITQLVAKVERAELVGVAGVPEERFAELREKMPEAYASAGRYEGIEELLARSGAELVSVCSERRDRQHEDIVRALEAGVHVYAEKPLATTMSGLEAIQAAAERSGRQVRSMTGMMYLEVFGEMRRIVESGRLGEVVQVFAQKSYPYHDGRPQDPGMDGGLLQQAGVHAVSFVRYVTGLEFEDLYAMDTTRGNPKPGELRMAAQFVARMTGGALATVVCNYCNPPGIGFWGNEHLRVHGTGGMVEVVDGARRGTVAIGNEKPVPLPAPKDTGGYLTLFSDYVNHILDGSPMLLSQDDSFVNSRVVIRADESAASGRPVKV